jgi:hypothetical protein
MAQALAKQLQLPELNSAECDWIVTAANRGVMVSEEDAAAVIGYLLGQANISPTSCDDQVSRAINP